MQSVGLKAHDDGHLLDAVVSASTKGEGLNKTSHVVSRDRGSRFSWSRSRHTGVDSLPLLQIASMVRSGLQAEILKLYRRSVLRSDERNS